MRINAEYVKHFQNGLPARNTVSHWNSDGCQMCVLLYCTIK